MITWTMATLLMSKNIIIPPFLAVLGGGAAGVFPKDFSEIAAAPEAAGVADVGDRLSENVEGDTERGKDQIQYFFLRGILWEEWNDLDPGSCRERDDILLLDPVSLFSRE